MTDISLIDMKWKRFLNFKVTKKIFWIKVSNYPEQYNFNRAKQTQKRVRLSKSVI